jgi:hypothetical protein
MTVTKLVLLLPVDSVERATDEPLRQFRSTSLPE